MTNEPINYKAVLADLEEKKKQIEQAIAGIKVLAAQAGSSPSTAGVLGPSVFLGMSIPDATKKLLEITRQKQPTQAIVDALEAGGLPKSKYTTVYTILQRREKQVGDVINMNGDWALASWYPNYRQTRKAAAARKAGRKKSSANPSSTKKAETPRSKPKVEPRLGQKATPITPAAVATTA